MENTTTAGAVERAIPKEIWRKVDELSRYTSQPNTTMEWAQYSDRLRCALAETLLDLQAHSHPGDVGADVKNIVAAMESNSFLVVREFATSLRAALTPSALSGDAGEGAAVQQTVRYHVQFEFPHGLHGDKVWQDAVGYSDTLERARQCLRLLEGYRRKEPLVGSYGRVHLGGRVVRRVITTEETVMPDAAIPAHQGAGE